MAEKVLELRAWAEEETEQGGSGERDNAPRHTDREWRQVSVNHRECLGASKCPFGAECFAELAREKAHRSHLIVTNHSLLAIDAIEDVPMIPDYDTVVIDEAHELTARVTQAATDELGVSDIERAARRAMRWTDGDGDPAGDLEDAAQQLAEAIEATPPGRIDQVSTQLSDALVLVRDAARACLSAFPRESGGEGEADAGRTQAKGMVQEVFVNAERMAAGSQADVLWLGEARDRFPARLHVAPLQVWGPMRDKLLTDKTRRLHQRDADARRRVRRGRHLARPQAHRSGSATRSPPPTPTTRCRGRASTSARPSTTASSPSSTSPATCRSPAATASGTPSSTRSATSSTPSTAARSASSRPGAPPRPRPRPCERACRT